MVKKIIKELQGFKEELQKFDSIEVKEKDIEILENAIEELELYKWAFLGLKYAYLDSIDYEVENEAFK
ncbi:hypothetical protein P5F45_14000 [Clostridium perfringens]|nr:hypothetical protein [Clostridium perfringens]